MTTPRDSNESVLDRWRRTDPVVRLSVEVERELEALAASAGRRVDGLDAPTREALARALYWDMTSEFDARFYSAHVRGLDVDFSDEYCRAELQWAYDEAVHSGGLGRICQRYFGGDPEELAARRPDFGPIDHLFRDEFTICCLGAYDELVTVRAYRSQLSLYRALGPDVERFVRRVIADEGRHYGKFVAVIRRHHADRLDEVPDVVQEIAVAEGTPYRATFVLDHDDDVFAEWMYDEARAILLRHLAPRPGVTASI